MSKKFSFSIKIEQITPAHVFFRMFSGLIPSEYEHINSLDRGSMGGAIQVERNEAFPHFLMHVRPHLVFINEDCREDVFSLLVGKIVLTKQENDYVGTYWTL